VREKGQSGTGGERPPQQRVRREDPGRRAEGGTVGGVREQSVLSSSIPEIEDAEVQ